MRHYLKDILVENFPHFFLALIIVALIVISLAGGFNRLPPIHHQPVPTPVGILH